MSSTLTVVSGLVVNGLVWMILPVVEVRRKWDQPNHSSVGTPSCADAVDGTLATTSTATSAAMSARARCPARRRVFIFDPSTTETVSAPPGRAASIGTTDDGIPTGVVSAATLAVPRVIALLAAPLPDTNG